MTEQSPDIDDEMRASIKNKVAHISEHLLSFYDMQVDLQGLLGDIPLKDNENEASYLSRFLKRLGFHATIENVKDLDLSTLERPALAHANQQTYALVMPSKAYGTDRYIFGANDEDLQALSAQPYSGDVLIIDKASENIGDYIAHMEGTHSLDWFWLPILQYRRNYYEILVASIFINTLVLAIPLFSLNIYDRVVINFVEETLYVLTMGAIIALVFDFLFKTIRTYILERLAEKLGTDYDFRLMERLMNIRTADATLSVGEQANMFRELQTIREFYASKLVPTLVDMPFITLFLYIIYHIGGSVVVVPIATIVLILLINMSAHFPISKMMTQYFSTTQTKSRYLIETLSGLPALRMFNAHSNRLFHWDRATGQAARVSRHHMVTINFLSNLTFMFSQVCHVLVIFFGVYLIHEGTMTIGGLITCSILSGRAIAPAMNLSSLIARLKQSEDVLKAIDNCFKLPHFDDENRSKAPKGPFKGEINVSDMTYMYPGQERPALHKINVSIPAGSHIGIIGASAAGKSTLAKAIGQLIIPSSGDVTLDGLALDAIPHTELCRAVSYAPQDSVFFNGSVLYNITLGREDIDKDALAEAIDVSGLEIVLKNNAEGLDMEVGDQGCRLSGGQKQALSLARALARRPQVLIFDEPTTGMDNALEAHVQKKLRAYTAGKTFIMITHRTSLLSLVDRLVLLDKGRMIADGPKQEIMDKLSGRG